MAATAPRFSVVTAVYDPPVAALREMIDSVLAQSEPSWELVLVDDRSPDAAVRDVLEAAAREDPRVRFTARQENGGIVAASNDAIDLARGEFLVFVDHDDLLTPDALARVAEELDAHPDADYVYSDEDKIGPGGALYDVFRKPTWSPERLRGQMYTSHLSVMRTDLVREVGALRPGFDGSQDHDLALRVTERAREVRHIPEVLYHWRAVEGSAAADLEAKPYAWEAGRRAVDEHLQRSGLRARAELGPFPGTYRVVRRPLGTPLVSIVIPTRGGSGLVWGDERVFVVEAVRSVLRYAGYPRFEIVVVYDTPTPPAVLDELRRIGGDRVRLVEFDQPFNFSAKCNVGFLHSRGDVVVMLNDDTEVRSAEFLDRLIAPLDEEDVAATGAHLSFEDGTLQHGGHIYFDGEMGHAWFGQSSDGGVGFSALAIAREVSGLTAACLALRREVYEEVGGFTEALPGNFNDVDFSLKLRGTGRRLVWLPDVQAYHFESRTRVPTVHEWEIGAIRRRWDMPQVDPYLPGLN